MILLMCEICGNPADKHHIVYKSQGGIEFPLNFRYLCSYHHRGNVGPHKNRRLDLEYKISMQRQLEDVLIKGFYFIEELESLLKINRGMIKRLFKEVDINNKTLKKSDIIFRIMGRKKYDEKMLLEVKISEKNFKEI